jgi:hypothetical protein
MSVSATKRLTPTHSLSFPRIAVAVLAALALVAVLVAISVSNGSHATTGSITPSVGTTPASERVIPGYFRDPTTHALSPMPASQPSEDTPGPGHK